MGQCPLGNAVLRPAAYFCNFRVPPDACRIVSMALLLLPSALLVGANPSAAAQLVLAISGDLQPGGSGAIVTGVGSPLVNNAGQVVLQANLADGVGGVGSHNDAALWFVDGMWQEVVARKGDGNLADGASWTAFAAASIADDGDVAFKASTDQGKQGYWRAARDGGLTTIALSATPGVPGQQLEEAQYESFGFQLFHTPSDAVAYSARLVRRVGGVDTINSRGIWQNLGGPTELTVRASLTAVPELPSARFSVPSLEGINDASQMAVLGSLVEDFGGVTHLDALGVFRIGGPAGSDRMVARRNLGEAAGVAGGLFGAFSDLRINAAGAISYMGELQLQDNVTIENHRGLWLFDGMENRLIARTGAGAVGGVAGADFESFGAPLLNDASRLLYSGKLKTGVGGVTAETASGVWIADGTSAGALVARSGVGGVPGVPAAKFQEFGGLAFNRHGVVALTATLEPDVGGVGAANDQGLWLMDASGDGRLVARAGDQIAGQTVASLEFAAGSGGGDGRPRALNDHGQFAYKAVFTNGEEAALLYTPELSWRLPGNGNWDDSSRWTFGLAPSSVHAVAAATNNPTTIIGPSGSATVKRLQLGGGSGETTLEIPESGMLTVLEGLQLAANGRLAGKGTLVGEVVNAGSTSPGASTGVLAIDGDYRQEAGGRLAIEIGGVDNSSPIHKTFDQLLVFGRAELGGVLDVSLVDGFVPAIGDAFPILKATGGMTNFDTLQLPMLPSDREWRTTSTFDTLLLSVVGASAASGADFNRDGSVDGDDLAIWQASYGSAAGGDADGDGIVDGGDFLQWQREFTGKQASTTAAQVPEPTAAGLLFVAFSSTLATATWRLGRRDRGSAGGLLHLT